jgi:protein TonB
MRIQLQMTTPSGIVEESVRVLRAGSGGISGTEMSGTRARSSAPVRVEPPPVAEDPTERPPSVGKIFVPPVRKSNAPVETDVIEPPQLNFASSSSLPQVKLPKVDVRVPLPVQTALAAPVVVPPVALTDLAVYIPLAWRTPDVAGREVSVKVHVDNQGRVASVDAGKLSPRLAAAIADAAKRWRFNPATASGKAVPSEMTIHLRFPANR